MAAKSTENLLKLLHHQAAAVYSGSHRRADTSHEGRLIRINPDALRTSFVRILEKPRLPRLRFRDLRHFGTFMLAGYGDRYVEAYGGWEPGSDIMKRNYQTLIDS